VIFEELEYEVTWPPPAGCGRAGR